MLKKISSYKVKSFNKVVGLLILVSMVVVGGGGVNLAPFSLSVAYGEQLTWSHSRVRSDDDAVIRTSTQVRNEGTFDPGTNVDSTTKKTLFDLSISLYNTPVGDNDSTTDSGTGDDQQNRYEQVIEYFADAVCEQTNTQHKLGIVSLFKGGALKGSADIVWQGSGRPGSALSGFGIQGRHIYMYDTFGPISITNTNADDRQKLGSLLGHEWGHYVYGLFDEHSGDTGRTSGNSEEYEALAGDGVATLESIMKDAIQAVDDVTDSYNWLNHSTSILDSSDMKTGSSLVDTNPADGDLEDLGDTVQGRVYGKSGWEVLEQSPEDDPKELELGIDYPGRTVYEDLTTPTGVSGYEIGLPGAQTDCRSDLKIVWHEGSNTANTLRGHSETVWSVSYSPDGTQLASGSGDITIRLWDVATGDRLRTIEDFKRDTNDPNHNPNGHNGVVSSVSYSPDGTQLASGSHDNTIRLWDVATGRHIHTLRGHRGDVTSVSYSPDGTQLASGSGYSDYTIRLWDVATGQHIRTLTGHNSRVVSVSFSPDGMQLASGSYDDTIRLWDVATGQHIRTLTGHTRDVRSVSYSPDGTQLASGSYNGSTYSGEIRLWDVATGQHIRTLTGHSETVWSVSYSPDGTQLASGSADDTIRLWDVATGQHIRTLTGHTSTVVSVSYSPDGTQLASGGERIYNSNNGQYEAEIRLWDVATVANSIYLNLRSEKGKLITYPQPLLLTMSVTKDLPITGVGVNARITLPNDTVSNAITINLNDEGVAGDAVIGDGIYSIVWDGYTEDGVYDIHVDVDNVDEGAYYTTTGLLNAKLPQGTRPISLPIFSSSIDVSTGLQVILQGVEEDDHEDDPSIPNDCSSIRPDNKELAGKIEVAGDVDCFRLISLRSLDVSEDLVIRLTDIHTSSSYGPTFTVYSSDGSTVVATWSPDTHTVRLGGFILTIPAADVDRSSMIVAVKDVDVTASGWSYGLSAGKAIVSDTRIAPDPRPEPPPPSTTVSLSVSPEPVVEGEMATITATLESVVAAEVTVSLGTTLGIGTGYAASTDLNTTLANIVIPANTLSETTTLSTIQDTDIEGDETFGVYIDTITATGLSSSFLTNGTPSTNAVTVTIQDDDIPSVSLRVGSPTMACTRASDDCVKEGGTVTITATLSETVNADVAVTLATTSSSTADSRDYTLSTSMTIVANELNATGTLSTIDDTIPEGDETIEVYIGTITATGVSSSVANGTPQTRAETVTIEDDEAPSLTLSVSPNLVSEGGDATITATLSKIVNADVEVTLAVASSSTATVTLDYTLPTSITIAANELGASVSLSTIQDTLPEGDKTIEVYIGTITATGVSSSVTNGTPQASVETTVTILDDDIPNVSLSVSEDTVVEGDSTTITATLSYVVNAAVEVTLSATARSTATEPDDYRFPTITIAANELSATGMLSTIDDTLPERDETIEMYIATITSSTLVSNSTSQSRVETVTIEDNEPASLSLSVSSATVLEGGSVNIIATLTKTVDASVVVTLGATARSTATEPDDYRFPTSITIPTNALSAEATLTTIQDTIPEGDEIIEMYIASITSSLRVLNGSTQVDPETLTIIDDEKPVADIKIFDGRIRVDSIRVAEGGRTTLSILLNQRAKERFTIQLDVISGTARRDEDFILAQDSVVFEINDIEHRVGLSIEEDEDEEGDETVTIGIRNDNDPAFVIDPSSELVTVTIIGSTDDEEEETDWELIGYVAGGALLLGGILVGAGSIDVYVIGVLGLLLMWMVVGRRPGIEWLTSNSARDFDNNG